MKKLVVLLALLLTFIFIPKTKAYKAAPLDYIEEFNIIVSPNSDATLNFDYELKWKVLDDSSEGPLEWVKIGIPNKYISNINVISTDTISKASYYNDSGSTCIRLDLNRKYKENEVVNMHFSFRQSHMFAKMNEKDNLVKFQYIPGWFDDIAIGKLTINWDRTITTYYDNSQTATDNYLIWTTSLAQGARLKDGAQISYEKSMFSNINISDSYAGPTDDSDRILFIVVLVIIVSIVIILLVLGKIFRRASYYRTRGFYPYGVRHFFYRPYYYGVDHNGSRKTNPYVSVGGAGHSGHSCACACACACAGGGRAGCSKKDFYKGKIDINKLIDKMNKED